MRTFQVHAQIHVLPRAASSSAQTQSSGSSSRRSGAMSALSPASVTLTALLILCIPVCTGAPAELYQTTRTQRQFLSQIDAVCSSYLSADLKMWPSDVLGELCVLMLIQKSKELKVRESSKRAELQGPGGIQSRGYFLYRPRNGRRSLEDK
ncbi:neuromedin-U [Cheilinus undulatus]|uniref:neuromedin-U n=1 Tax=Cheilinus undulatus TaxID=241271 RepID=UPI001BD3F59F|nr:neuromedin-U [Cheilinus undulatus]